jgi:hypothetical protein
MYVSINGKQLSSSSLLAVTLRYDLTPIPSTLELDIRLDDTLEQLLKEGKLIEAGHYSDSYKIVMTELRKDQAVTQGDSQVKTMRVTALLDSVHKLSYRQPRAVIKERASLGEIYRACGSKVGIGEDFNVARFTCFAGYVPTFAIMTALNEENAAVVYKNKRLSFVRINDLFKKEAASIFSEDTAQSINSEFIERNELPWAYSLGNDGAFIQPNRATPRAALFLPRSGERILQNNSKCLIVRKKITVSIEPSITAGDIFSIANKKYVVITAAHTYETGEAGSNKQQTTVWLGDTSR